MVVSTEYESGPSGRSSPEDASRLHLGGDGALVLCEKALVIEIDGSSNGKATSSSFEKPNPIYECFQACTPKAQQARTQADTPQSIPYYNILWASLESSTLTISYTQSTSKDIVTPVSGTFKVPDLSLPSAQPWLASLLNRAYGKSQRNKRIKVIINPFSGRGSAVKIYTKTIAPIFEAAHCIVDVQHTTHAKHAEQMARELNVEEWDVIACCSGDGIPHEVFNGLAQQSHPQLALRSVAVTQLPGGSGNGMSWNLHGTGSASIAALSVVKGLAMPLDLVSITQGTTRTLSFLSQAVGIIAESDLGTESWRWMGDTRFTIGYMLRLMRQTVWPVDLALGIEIDDKDGVKLAYRKYVDSLSGDLKPLQSPVASSSSSDNEEQQLHANADADATSLPPLRFGTINEPLPSSWKLVPYENLGNFYAGKMAYMTANSNVFPASVPADGLLDLMMVDGDISRRRALDLADDVGRGTLMDQAEVRYIKVSGYRIIPREKEGYISIDGERIPFQGFQAEVHKALGCALSKSGKLYESYGPKDALNLGNGEVM